MRKIKISWPILLIIIFTLFFFHQLFYPKIQLIYTPDFGSSDIFHFNYSLKDFLSQSLKKGEWPLWTDYINSGFPVLAEGQIGTFNISNLILYKFLPTYLAFNLTIIIIFLTMAIGQYLLLRAYKLSSLPAILGTISFTFSEYFITKITHLNHIQAASFIPFTLYFLEKYLLKPKLKYLLGIIFLLSQIIFSGYPMMLFMVCLLFFCRLVFFFIKKKWSIKKIVIFFAPWLIAIIFTIGLSAIQLFPQLEYLRLSNLKSGFNFQDIVQYSYRLENLLRFLYPFILGDPTQKYDLTHYGIFWETSAFLGTMPFLLAILALRFLKQPKIKYFFCLFLLSLLLSFGQESPLYFIFTIFPFNLFRVPSRYLLLAVFALSCLAAFMLEKIRKRLSLRNYYIIAAATIAFTGYQLYFFHNHYHKLVDKDQLLSIPESVNFLKKEPDFLKVYEYAGFIPWSDYFRTDWTNQEMYLFLRNTLQPNSTLIWQMPAEAAYFTQWPRRFLLYKKILGNQFFQGLSDIQELLNPAFFTNMERGLQISGISHLILPVEVVSPGLKLIKKISFAKETIYIYKIAESNPKFFLTANYKIAKTLTEAENILKTSNSDNKTIILEKEVNLVSNPNNFNYSLEIIKDNHQQKLITINQNPQTQLLVIGQSFYPGWQAFIDDQKTEVLAANINKQAIMVPEGNHQIRLIYKPNSFIWGARISLISLAALIAVFVLARRMNLQIPWPFGHSGNIPKKSFLKKPSPKRLLS